MFFAVFAVNGVSRVIVKLVFVNDDAGLICNVIFARADLLDVGVYPNVFAIDVTEFLLTALSINISFA